MGSTDSNRNPTQQRIERLDNVTTALALVCVLLMVLMVIVGVMGLNRALAVVAVLTTGVGCTAYALMAYQKRLEGRVSQERTLAAVQELLLGAQTAADANNPTMVDCRLSEAWRIAQALTIPQDRATVAHQLADAHLAHGDRQQAASLAGEALQLYRSHSPERTEEITQITELLDRLSEDANGRG